MKPKKIKARKIWNYGTRFNPIKKHADNFASMRGEKVTPCYVLPADAASVEAMVEQVMIAITTRKNKAEIHTHRDLARAALAAIGIKGGAK